MSRLVVKDASATALRHFGADAVVAIGHHSCALDARKAPIAMHAKFANTFLKNRLKIKWRKFKFEKMVHFSI